MMGFLNFEVTEADKARVKQNVDEMHAMRDRLKKELGDVEGNAQYSAALLEEWIRHHKDMAILHGSTHREFQAGVNHCLQMCIVPYIIMVAPEFQRVTPGGDHAN